jgi:hypothetical protein
VVLAAKQELQDVSLDVEEAAAVQVVMQDPMRVFKQRLSDNRTPTVAVGVMSPAGQFIPARAIKTVFSVVSGQTDAEDDAYNYVISVPRDTSLLLYITNADLRLGDSNGRALAGAFSSHALRVGAGDPNRRTLVFRVLGLAATGGAQP